MQTGIHFIKRHDMHMALICLSTGFNIKALGSLNRKSITVGTCTKLDHSRRWCPIHEPCIYALDMTPTCHSHNLQR